MADTPPPDYYRVLGIPENAGPNQIREAYKKAALKTHPDRIKTDDANERARRTKQFQLVNDAYYTLSDKSRRDAYDEKRRYYTGFFRSSRPQTDPFADAYTAHEPEPSAGADADADMGADADAGTGTGQNFYSWAWNFFNGNGQGKTGDQQGRQRAEDAQFADVFEEMMREQGMADPDTNRPTGKFWSVIGGISGGALGFIMANVPGMIGGAVAGNRLGAVRDAKGKSVYSVFQELPQDERARLLSQLAAKVFSHAVGI